MEKGLTGNKLKIIAILSMLNQKIHFAKTPSRFRKVIQHYTLLATIENNHYESGENHQKKSKRKSHYYNNSKGSTIVLANNAQKIGANE